MLAYILAIIVAIVSFSFYMAAFFVPELHRRQDFFWSGLGLFYAVVLWFCAGRLTGAVLLGQLVSVVLLSVLGWQTLALRRQLTPELVQTPVNWEDLQRLGRSLQQQITQTVPLEAVARLLQATRERVGQTLANWRDRTASVAEPTATAEVPPLKRSPAYEFETASGDGQTIPSEFATVANRPLSQSQQVADPVEVNNESQVPEQPAASTNESDISQAESASAPSSAASPPAMSQPTAPPAIAADASAQTKVPASKSPSKNWQPNASTLNDDTQRAVSKPRQPSAQKTNPVASAIRWLGNRRQPKPPREVIEIPPRSPSIPRDSSATAAIPSVQASQRSPKAPRPAKAPRAVIDIPPRPPSIPRSPAASPKAPQQQPRNSMQSPKADEVNWAETGGPVRGRSTYFEFAEPPASSAEPSNPLPASADIDEPASEGTGSLASTDSLSQTTAQNQPSLASSEDTNWPDDGDTNWPEQ